MKRWLATCLVFAVCSAVVRADVTVVQTTTIEGGMAAMAPGGIPSPTITTRVKGLRSRADIEMAGMNMSTITDLTTMQVIILHHDQKTAQINTAKSAATTTTTAPIASMAVDGSVKPTGKSQVIDGIKCDEYAFTTSVSMSDMNGGQMPPEAAEMLKELKMLMTGSLWVSKEVPGAAEFLAYSKALQKSDMTAIAMSGSGLKMPGMEKMATAMSNVDGIAYLTEMNMTIDGTGQIADMMKQAGAMKMTVKTTSVKTDAVSDDLFKVPEGYTIVK